MIGSACDVILFGKMPILQGFQPFIVTGFRHYQMIDLDLG
jgi:hypothetical protein